MTTFDHPSGTKYVANSWYEQKNRAAKLQNTKLGQNVNTIPEIWKEDKFFRDTVENLSFIIFESISRLNAIEPWFSVCLAADSTKITMFPHYSTSGDGSSWQSGRRKLSICTGCFLYAFLHCKRQHERLLDLNASSSSFSWQKWILKRVYTMFWENVSCLLADLFYNAVLLHIDEHIVMPGLPSFSCFFLIAWITKSDFIWWIRLVQHKPIGGQHHEIWHSVRLILCQWRHGKTLHQSKESMHARLVHNSPL